ncbi:asparagine synthase C-terminal domain-containing protein [Nocardia puris]|uniref:Asparagine synthase (Glutamine-hydrolysing) n=1 Tax=Nocardia puris TaxID=208602 RepID=A0A366E414_9NOCA|nr:asparagine synthase C-terminal domain-containing protein [Nocardia puris]RBO97083.1 asparagine synthase (glutamine-hydrolysing) [Nocardia puris]
MTYETLAPQTAEPLQFVTDLVEDIAAPNPAARTLTDPVEAASLISEETRTRVASVLDKFGGTPAVLLSGGVDSIYVAAVAVHLGAKPVAVTIVTDGQSDEANAAAAARALGLRHDIIRLTAAEVVDLSRDVITRLGTSELWEVTAGIPLLAARRTFDAIPTLGAVLSGSGADAILGGGRTLTHSPASHEATIELDRLIRAESAANFRYDRLVPNFHPALLDQYADRLIHVFQTVRWWQVAERFAPAALFGIHDDRLVDKYALRLACEAQLPEEVNYLAWATKSPIQRSSGLMSVLATAARTYAANLPGAQTYTDPMTEDAEAVATRLYLSILGA